MVNSLDAGVAVAQMVQGTGNIINSNDPGSIINDSTQVIAGAATALLTNSNPFEVIGLNAAAILVTLGKMDADNAAGKPTSVDDILSVVGNIVTIAAVIAVNVTPVGRAARVFAGVAIGLGLYQVFKPFLITDAVAAGFNDSKTYRYPRDPILLDLDGNGIKTVGLAADVHFDFDSDGVLTQTGWVGNGDALLVLDRNTNGFIDNGSELFGDYTPITRTNVDGTTTTTFAPNGFAALASLDSNNDGIIDANDAAFAQLKLWRDTNQDGTTNSGELITLAQAGIVSLNLANVLKNQATGNGNTLTREGSFTKQVTTLDSATGQTTTQTVTQTMGEYNLAINTFDTQFKDNITISDTVKTLPNMQGSGNVRELQQAANDAAWRVAA